MAHIFCIPAFHDNYIWLLADNDLKYAAVVDPGDAAPVLSLLEQTQMTLVAILITHHHADHTGGIAPLVNAYQPDVYGPKLEHIPHITHTLTESDAIHLPNLNIKLSVLDVGGHTLGHIAYYQKGRLFCGDTLFAGGCGRVFEGTHQQMLNALNKIKQLPNDTSLYCAHEYTMDNLKFAKQVDPNNPALRARIAQTQTLRNHHFATVPSSLQQEKMTNPFLRVNIPDIINSVEQHSGQSGLTELEVFSILRQWKNTF